VKFVLEKSPGIEQVEELIKLALRQMSS